MRKTIRSLSFFFILVAMFTCLIGCCAFTDDDDYYDSYSPEFGRHTMGGQEGSSIVTLLGKSNPLAASHMMRSIPIKEPWMAMEDREYLEEQCGSCHDLIRVFWTRGLRSMWEVIVNEEHHQGEMCWEGEDLDRLYFIFQRYLSEHQAKQF